MALIGFKEFLAKVKMIISGEGRIIFVTKNDNISFRKNKEFHGMSNTREYGIWCNMISRCNNKKDTKYDYYGGRGITVCKKWQDSFLAFINDMGTSPSSNYSLDRINNDGNYEPSNCRWATASQQNYNQGLRKDNKTGYKGVYFIEKRGKYMASVRVDGILKHLGLFKTLSDAVKARQEAEVLYGIN